MAEDGSTATFSWLRTGGLPLLLGDGTSSFVHGPDGAAIEEIRADGTILWLHADQAGSIRVVTDQVGSIAGISDWDAYGSPTSQDGEAHSRLGFQGHYTDPGTGFQYLQARTYDPSTARFLSIDPLVARTRQPYAFAAGDPLTFGDPVGRIRCRCREARPSARRVRWRDDHGDGRLHEPVRPCGCDRPRP